jgi:hypothetical protein
MPRILVVGENLPTLARTIRNSREMGFDVVGVKADADLRHLWRNERFDAVVLRHGIDEAVRAEFLAEIRDRDPDMPVFDRDDSEEEMSQFLKSVVEELGG